MKIQKFRRKFDETPEGKVEVTITLDPNRVHKDDPGQDTPEIIECKVLRTGRTFTATLNCWESNGWEEMDSTFAMRDWVEELEEKRDEFWRAAMARP